MVQGVGRGGAAASAAAEATQVVNNTNVIRGGAGEAGGLVSQEKDQKQAATSAKFGDIYNQIQAKYGAKPEKPREIKKTLGKDDFLRIMITQMKNQDPTNPFKAEQMATEVAQFTSVEQLSNVNQNLTKMSAQNKPLEQLSMTNMIGKTVTIDRQRFPHLEGENESLSFTIPRDAAKVTVALVSDAGEEVLTREMGPQKAGEVNFGWDGRKNNTLAAKAGNYMIRVEAKNDKDQSIESNPQVQARVIGISFSGAEPVFLVGDARHQDKVTMRNIVRVDMDPAQAAPGLPNAGAPPTAPAEPKAPNFFTFQKGVGSGPIQMGAPGAPGPGGQPALSPEVASVLEKFQAMQQGADSAAPARPSNPAGLVIPAQARAEIQAAPPEERGFPNGLQDPDKQSQFNKPK